MPSTAQALQRSYDNMARILVLCTQVVLNPTRANIDAAIGAADAASIIRPKPTTSIDGESWDWTGYQQMLMSQMQALKTLIQMENGPWEIRTRPLL